MDLLFPIPPGYSDVPVWTGQGFQIGSKILPFLIYTQCNTGWDVGLTDFHEQEADAGNHYIDRTSRLHTIRKLERYIKDSDAVVLEIGSSSGYLIRDIKQSKPSLSLIGSDCIPDPLRKISINNPNIPLIQFDLNRCPLPDNCIDIVVALNVLEHIQDDETAMQQIYRILKPGGYAIIEVPANQDLYDLYDEQLKHFRRYNFYDFAKKAKKNNFAIIEASHIGFFIYPIFKYVKLKNKKCSGLSDLDQKKKVSKFIRFGGPIMSNLLFFFLILELNLGRVIRYPFGIRCVFVLRKLI